MVNDLTDSRTVEFNLIYLLEIFKILNLYAFSIKLRIRSKESYLFLCTYGNRISYDGDDTAVLVKVRVMALVPTVTCLGTLLMRGFEIVDYMCLYPHDDPPPNNIKYQMSFIPTWNVSI